MIVSDEQRRDSAALEWAAIAFSNFWYKGIVNRMGWSWNTRGYPVRLYIRIGKVWLVCLICLPFDLQIKFDFSL